MQHDNRWRHKNRICKRNLKSFYFDKETQTIKQATQCPSYPPVRPYRYIFICQSTYTPKLQSDKVISLLHQNGYTMKRINKLITAQDLPF